MSLSTGLFFIFLILKLTDQVSWSWFIVTMPLWIGLVIWIPFIIFAFYLKHRSW